MDCAGHSIIDKEHCIEFNFFGKGGKLSSVPLDTEGTSHHIDDIYFQ